MFGYILKKLLISPIFNLLIILQLVVWVTSDSPCEVKKTCSACIQTPHCSWCLAQNFSSNRCFDASKKSSCNEEFIISPENIYQTLSAIQTGPFIFEPQEVRLKLVVGQPYSFNIKYKKTDLSRGVHCVPTISYIAPDAIAINITKVAPTEEKTDSQLYNVQIELLKCPSDAKKFFNLIEIYAHGESEKIKIYVEMVCKCPCENPASPYYEASSPRCSYSGTYTCGICDCSQSYYGARCECTGEPVNDCKKDDNPYGVECSGRGECICGYCMCNASENPHEAIYGKYCECDNFSCDRNNGLICNGHGICRCGNCRCDDDWTGDSCEINKVDI